MEIREFAERIFFADTLEGKLHNPAQDLVHPVTGRVVLTDHTPGEALPWSQPSRPTHLMIAPRKQRKKIPKVDALHKHEMRVRCLHTFANHELMALEMMAWALLAYPDAPTHFREGLVSIILDEQEHCQLYIQRVQEMGASFGDLPLNDHFWRAAHFLTDPLKWVCCMHLTFEQANLDHAPHFARAFTRVEDHASAALMQKIFEDEIMHVRFGGHWLRQFAPDDTSPFDAFLANISPRNPVNRARGDVFNADARRIAGLDEAFIASLEEVDRHKYDRKNPPQNPTTQHTKHS